MKTEIRSIMWVQINSAIKANLIPAIRYDRKNFLSRTRKAIARNLAEPGDCANDLPLLIGLAIAQAEIGIRPGWIPAVQSLGCTLADFTK